MDEETGTTPSLTEEEAQDAELVDQMASGPRGVFVRDAAGKAVVYIYQLPDDGD